MRRSGLPRWARPARPRVIKAPAQPSLLSIIRNDQVWELQERVCKTGSVVMMEVGYSEDFWEKHWPRMVRQACQNLSQKCLNMLLIISPQYGDKRRTLPPQTLAWVIKGLEADSVHRGLSSLDRQMCDSLLREIADNPIQLRAEDGLRLLRMGGYRTLFHIHRHSDEAQAVNLAQSDSFRSAWHTWCASKSNRDLVLELIANKDTVMGRFTSTTQMFEEVVLEMPRQHRAAYLDQVCDLLEKTPPRAFVSDDVRSMNKWHSLFVRSGWSMEHPVWESWGKRLCRALEVAQPKSSVGEELTRLLIVDRSELPGQPVFLPGWSWTPAMREGLVRSQIHSLQDLLECHEHDYSISDEHLARVGTFLHHTLKAEEVLDSWGMVDNDARKHLDAVFDQALGERWQERLNAVIYDNLENAASLQRAWTAWKARHLKLDWVEPVTPIRARPRM